MTKREPSRADARALLDYATFKQTTEGVTPTWTASPSDLLLPGGGDTARAVETPLIEQIRELYENWVLPVAEIARLAGVAERTLYKYVQRGGWRRRHRYQRDDLRDGADAIDARARLERATAQLSADAEARAAERRADEEMEADLRMYQMLADALIELVKMRSRRKEGANPQADLVDARLQDLICAQMERLLARGGPAGKARAEA